MMDNIDISVLSKKQKRELLLKLIADIPDAVTSSWKVGYTSSEIMSLLGIGRSMLTDLTRSGILPSIKLQHKRYYPGFIVDAIYKGRLELLTHENPENKEVSE